MVGQETERRQEALRVQKEQARAEYVLPRMSDLSITRYLLREELKHEAERKASAEAARVEAEAAEQRLAEQRAEADKALKTAISKYTAENNDNSEQV